MIPFGKLQESLFEFCFGRGGESLQQGVVVQGGIVKSFLFCLRGVLVIGLIFFLLSCLLFLVLCMSS
jgi:hypothetical protein